MTPEFVAGILINQAADYFESPSGRGLLKLDGGERDRELVAARLNAQISRYPDGAFSDIGGPPDAEDLVTDVLAHITPPQEGELG